MTTTRQEQLTTKTLHVAMELSAGEWKLAFAVDGAQKPRRRAVSSCTIKELFAEIDAAKERFHLDPSAPVLCCYEAGRDGFWIHRALTEHGIENLVVDSSSIEVNRRQRRAKSDRLDVEKLLSMLIRWRNGEEKVWSVVLVPSEDQEDARRLHRELEVLKNEQKSHMCRIKSLLATVGLKLPHITRLMPDHLAAMRMYNGQSLPRAMHEQLLREFERMKLANQQIRTLEQQQAEQIRHGESREMKLVRTLMELRAIGPISSWVFVMELFGWRRIENRRQLAGLVGLTPTPYDSGNSKREQGISKGGNKRVRAMLIEIAWSWLRYQPDSELTQWYQRRFAGGSTRQRRIGIVALARKLLIVLWKYLKGGELADEGLAFRKRESVSINYTPSLS